MRDGRDSQPSVGAKGPMVFPAALSRTAAMCLIVGPIFFTLVWFTLGFVSPGFTIFGTRVEPYSFVTCPISGLGLGETAPFMNTAFVLTGISLTFGVTGVFLEVSEIGRGARWSCIGLLGLSGVGAILDGIFTLESFLPHFIGFGLGCGAPVLGFLVAGLVLRRVPRFRHLAGGLIVASPLTLALLVLSLLTFDPIVVAAGHGVAGLAQRVLIVEVQSWFVALGVTALQAKAWSAVRQAHARP
jgi:hypothetical protein